MELVLELLEIEILTGLDAGKIVHLPLSEPITIGSSPKATVTLKGDLTLLDYHCGVSVEPDGPTLRARTGQTFRVNGEALNHLLLRPSQLVNVGMTLLGLNLYRGARLPEEKELEAWFAEAKLPIWVLLSKERDRALLAWLARLPETASWPGAEIAGTPFRLLALPNDQRLWTLFSRQPLLTFWASADPVEALAERIGKWIAADPAAPMFQSAEALDAFLSGLSPAARDVFLGPAQTVAGWKFQYERSVPAPPAA